MTTTQITRLNAAFSLACIFAPIHSETLTGTKRRGDTSHSNKAMMLSITWAEPSITPTSPPAMYP